MSCFARALRPCSYAVRVRNDGAKPRLTRAKPLFFKKTRLDNISLSPLKLWRPQRDPVRGGARPLDAANLVSRKREPEIHARDQCAGVHPRVGSVFVPGRRLALIERHPHLRKLLHQRTPVTYEDTADAWVNTG